MIIYFSSQLLDQAYQIEISKPNAFSFSVAMSTFKGSSIWKICLDWKLESSIHYQLSSRGISYSRLLREQERAPKEQFFKYPRHNEERKVVCKNEISIAVVSAIIMLLIHQP